MLEHEKIIRRMSLKDKITFLFSGLKFRNSELEDFEFPLFNISDEVTFLNKDQTKLFLSNKAIASTWNKQTFKDVFAQVSKNLETNGILQIYSINGNVKENKISEDFYLNLQLQMKSVEVLKHNKNLTCLSLLNFNHDFDDNFDVTSLTYETIFKTTGIDSVLVSNVDDYKFLKEKYNYDGYVFGCTNSFTEAIKFLNAGSVVTFIDEIDEEELQNEIVKAMDDYALKARALKDDMISKENFEKSIENGEITSQDIIDKNCNQLIKIFIELSRRNGDANNGENVNSFTAFNKHIAIDDCAEQSVILLKNENNILPLKHNTKVAILGDSINQNNNSFSKERGPLDFIKKYEELIPVGYAQGYMLNHPTDAILVNDAYNLSLSADVSIVYLSIDKNGRVPTNQLTLINTLKKNGIKIIGVLNNPETKDFSYVDYCDAVIFSYYDRNLNAKAVLDVILGDINPSGRLIQTVIADKNIESDGCAPLYAKNYEHKFPFGFGLSYTYFEYSNLEISDKGVKFTLRNVGEYDGFATPQLYIQNKESTHALKNRLLKGFEKVYLRKGEATKVFVAFDETTFRYFNVQKKLYGVEKGIYDIYIGESYDDIRLEGTISLVDYIFGEEVYRSIKDEDYVSSENPIEDFIEINDDSKTNVDKSFLNRKTRIIYTLLIGGTFSICTLYVLISYIASLGLRFDAFFIIMLTLFVLLAGITAFFTVMYIRKKDAVDTGDTNEVLTNIVDGVNDFYEESREVYAVYEAPEEQEEIIKEISETPEYEEETQVVASKPEEIERKYVANYETKSTAVTFNDYNSIDELCNQFMSYTRTKGLALEIESARRLWAAILSSKLVFLTGNDKELLIEAIQYLIEFLGSNTFIQEASNKWKKTKDTLWKKTRIEFLPSNFANSLNNAATSRECLNIIPLLNVRIENLFYYFNDFIENANNPLQEIKVELNEDTTITLPKNICYILVPEDPSYYDNLPYYISNISFEVNLVLERVEKEEEKEFKHISYNNLLEIISTGKDKFYMNESKWKNYDEFEDAVSKTDEFAIGNKATLQMESFFSCYLECGGDINDVNDVIFLTKIIPMMKSTSLYKNETGEKDLIDLIQNTFENDDMTNCIKACKRIDVVTPFVVEDDGDSEENYEEVKDEVVEVESSEEKTTIEIRDVEEVSLADEVVSNEEEVMKDTFSEPEIQETSNAQIETKEESVENFESEIKEEVLEESNDETLVSETKEEVVSNENEENNVSPEENVETPSNEESVEEEKVVEKPKKTRKTAKKDEDSSESGEEKKKTTRKKKVKEEGDE